MLKSLNTYTVLLTSYNFCFMKIILGRISYDDHSHHTVLKSFTSNVNILVAGLSFSDARYFVRQLTPLVPGLSSAED